MRLESNTDTADRLGSDGSRPIWLDFHGGSMCKSILFGGQMCTERSYIVTNPLNSSHEEM
uniref:Uncharacterized protein n=1 Tax=Salix viminalis TaxID=40686 RepID=A0A6N2NDN5_SALVM